jgi:hypothetical protein
VIVYTAIHDRLDVLAVWCNAIRQMTQEPVSLHAYYSHNKPTCCEVALPMPHVGIGAASYVVKKHMPAAGVFIEPDIFPVRPWSVADYPGDLRVLEGAPGRGWHGFTIARRPGQYDLIRQRYVRDGGCPDWLPADLCEPALEANAKVVGKHFLHLDKMSRQVVPYADAKNKLLEMLRQRFRPGLGDYVAAGLSAVGITPERVSDALGVKDCGCKKRQAKLNELGRRLGIG